MTGFSDRKREDLLLDITTSSVYCFPFSGGELRIPHFNSETFANEASLHVTKGASINKLIDNPELSSVIPVHEKSEYHPYRARTITRDGLMIPFFDFSNMTVSGNRQDLPTCYFFDHSIWVLSVEKGIKSNGGQPPWTCMGDKLLPYVTHGCFDVHDLDDLKRTEAWILENKVPIPKFINGELF